MTDLRLTPQEEHDLKDQLRDGVCLFERRYLLKLLAEIDRLRGERQWQSIETAPKDGSMFLTCRHSEDGPLVVITCWYGKRHGYWLTLNNTVIEPTHWMPLPAAPDATVPPRPQEGAWDEQRGHWLEAWEKAHPDEVKEASDRLRDHTARQQGEDRKS